MLLKSDLDVEHTGPSKMLKWKITRLQFLRSRVWILPWTRKKNEDRKLQKLYFIFFRWLLGLHSNSLQINLHNCLAFELLSRRSWSYHWEGMGEAKNTVIMAYTYREPEWHQIKAWLYYIMDLLDPHSTYKNIIGYSLQTL